MNSSIAVYIAHIKIIEMHIKGQIVDIIKRRIFPGEIEIQGNRISKIIKTDEAPDRYILPGFIDAHVHIESSMVLPSRFAEVAVSHGTVAVVSDPHEIANVMGKEGVYFMIEDGKKVPFSFYFGAPSCVPATPFDSSGAVLGTEDINELLSNDDISFLSEMMNFPGVINRQEDVVRKLQLAVEKNKPIDGHAPGLSGEDLKKYVSAGISTDHECFTLEEAREKIKLEMKIQIREGSAAMNFEALHPLIAESPDQIMFCTDDCHPNDFMHGHINKIVKKALAGGYDLYDVLRAASLNARDHYRLQVGILQEGDFADFIVVNDLHRFEVEETWIKGYRVYANHTFQWKRPEVHSINNFKSRKVKAEEIVVAAPDSLPKIHVIQALDNELITKSFVTDPLVQKGIVMSDTGKDILKVVVVNRYTLKRAAAGFIHGFGLENGAIGSSIAHDSHNLIAIGVNDRDILRVLNALMETGGGIAVSAGENLHQMALPVAGLMSMDPVSRVAQMYQELDERAHQLGCRLNAPFMTLAFMSLLVIPDLKIGDNGLFDVKKFNYTSLFTDK